MDSQLLALSHEYIIAHWDFVTKDGIKNKVKKFSGNTFNWSLENAKNQLERKEQDGELTIGVYRKMILEGSGFVCIDIDVQNVHYMDMIQAFPQLRNTLYVAGNTKGGHFYVKTDWIPPKDLIECLSTFKGDIISKQVFELEGKEWNNKPIQYLSAEELQNMVIPKFEHYFDGSTPIVPRQKISDDNVAMKIVEFTPFHRAILDNISKEHYVKYDEWCKFLWAIRYSYFPDALDIADGYCNKVEGYISKEDVENKMFDARSARIGWEYLLSLSKKSDSKKHSEIMKENKKSEKEKTRLQDIAIRERARTDRELLKEEAKAERDRIKEEEREKKLALVEEQFETLKNTFEETHLKIISLGLYLREDPDGVVLLSEKKLRESYNHISCGTSMFGLPIPFINKWIGCNDEIRSKNRIGVYPANDEPEDTYNMWKPFAMEQVLEWEDSPIAVNIFQTHVDILCNHEKHIAEWFTRWLAYMIQFPEKKRGVMPVFVSEEGAGKNLLLDVIKKLIGSTKVFESTQPDRDVFGNFNTLMSKSYLVVLSEISASDLKDGKGKLKALISDKTISINQKGIDTYELQSFHKFIVFTNNEEAIKPTKGDRRNVVIRCSDELCRFANGVEKPLEEQEKINEYIKTFLTLMDNVDYQKSIYEWLKTIDVSNFATELPIKSDFHQTQMELSISPIEHFMKDFTLEHQAKDEVKMSSGSLYMQFKDWCSANYKHYECTVVAFGIRLKHLNIDGITKGAHTKKGEVKIMHIPTLKKHFNIKEIQNEPQEIDNNDTFSEL